MAGKSLRERKAVAARRAMMEEENRLAWNGDAACGYEGLLGNSNILTNVIAADGSGAIKDFAAKTPDLMLRDLNSAPTAIHAGSKGVEAPDTKLLPLAEFNLIFVTQLSSGSDMTVGKFFLENSPHIDSIDWLTELEAAASGEDLMLDYKRDPNWLSLEIPQDFEQLPVQERNLEMVVPTHMRHGGVLVYYPLAIAKTVITGA